MKIHICVLPALEQRTLGLLWSYYLSFNLSRRFFWKFHSVLKVGLKDSISVLNYQFLLEVSVSKLGLKDSISVFIFQHFILFHAAAINVTSNLKHFFLIRTETPTISNWLESRYFQLPLDHRCLWDCTYQRLVSDPSSKRC